MKSATDRLIIEALGKDNLKSFAAQNELLNSRQELLTDISDLRHRADSAFAVKLTIPDIIVSAATGILLGIANALFKDFIPQHGQFKHKHGTTRTAVDYHVPKPPEFKGSVQDLHRQIGPGHDIFRFKEALDLMSGKSADFSLWGKTATNILGHPLRPGNLPLTEFAKLGGFKIPENPAAELFNHLLIDFFTKRSLPIPGSSLLADSSPEMAKAMLGMYKEGLNLKSFGGNFLGFSLVQVTIHGYTFLFKAIPDSAFSPKEINGANVKKLLSTYSLLTKKNEFHVSMMIAHGSSFLVDTIITTSSKNYAGLFQLNYLSLLAFSKHLLQYLVKGFRDYNELVKQMRTKGIELDKIDAQWYSSFRENLLQTASNAHFLELFDPQNLAESHSKVVDSAVTISRNIERGTNIKRELENL